MNKYKCHISFSCSQDLIVMAKSRDDAEVKVRNWYTQMLLHDPAHVVKMIRGDPVIGVPDPHYKYPDKKEPDKLPESIKDNEVVITLYGTNRVCDRKKAIKEITDWWMASEGSEKERYTNLLYGLEHFPSLNWFQDNGCYGRFKFDLPKCEIPVE